MAMRTRSALDSSVEAAGSLEESWVMIGIGLTEENGVRLGLAAMIRC